MPALAGDAAPAGGSYPDPLARAALARTKRGKADNGNTLQAAGSLGAPPLLRAPTSFSARDTPNGAFDAPASSRLGAQLYACLLYTSRCV